MHTQRMNSLGMPMWRNGRLGEESGRPRPASLALRNRGGERGRGQDSFMGAVGDAHLPFPWRDLFA